MLYGAIGFGYLARAIVTVLMRTAGSQQIVGDPESEIVKQGSRKLNHQCTFGTLPILAPHKRHG